MSTAIYAYDVGKFVHILALLLAFGPTYGYAFFIAMAERNSPAAVPSVLRSFRAIDKYMVTPGLIVLLLAGIYMLTERDISLSESWVGVGIAAVIVLLGMTHTFFAPRERRALELAERDLASGGELSDEYRALSRQMAIGGNIAGLIVIVTAFFMVVKP
jgi:uncharacterized membrane protein